MQATLLLSPTLRRHYRSANARRLEAGDGRGTEWSQRQFQAVRTVWADAFAEIPYYNSLVISGRAPREIRSWDDFRAIPVLTRKLLQDRPQEFIRHSGPPDEFIRTAGSTGTPLRLGMNRAERDQMRIVKLEAWMRFGYTPASRLFLIWGHSHLLGTGWKGRFNHLKRKVADAFLGYRRVDAYRLNRASCELYANQLIRHRPLGIIGYASALDLFVRYTAAFHEQFRSLGIRFVLATSEPAPRFDTISLLEDCFGCPVVQEYGGAEFGQVAFKIGPLPFQVYNDLNYLECEPPGPHEPNVKSVLVTALYPRYVPLIRYRVGDGIKSSVETMHGHVKEFGEIAGRLNDVIELEDGHSVHSVAILHCIHQESSVYNIQMVIADNGVTIRLIAEMHQRAEMEERIRCRLGQVHPLLAKARFEYLEDLETNRAGKRRWFVDRRSHSQRRA